MIDDPIVEEVYQARQRILDRCQGDLLKWMERLKSTELQQRSRIVTMDAIRAKRPKKDTSQLARG